MPTHQKLFGGFYPQIRQMFSDKFATTFLFIEVGIFWSESTIFSPFESIYSPLYSILSPQVALFSPAKPLFLGIKWVKFSAVKVADIP